MPTVTMRYFVRNTDDAIAFYRDRLGFAVDMHPNPSFAMLSRGDLRLALNVPGEGPGAGKAMADGTLPQPGGWNRFQLEVQDLESLVGRLRGEGVHFRNDLLEGMGGKQILAEDPSGNLVELFEPTRPEARL